MIISGNQTVLSGSSKAMSVEESKGEEFELIPDCQPDHTLDPVSLTCRPCTTCGPNSHVKKACDSKRDTLCECNRDFYYDDGDIEIESNLCRPCNLCPHGWGAYQSCTHHRNSVCEKCEPGTYSSFLSSTSACFPCSTCKRYQQIVHNCSSLHDTVCVDADRHSKIQVKHVASSTPAAHLDYYHLKPSDHHSVWPIYSAVLLTLLLAVLAYFVLKKWKLSSTFNSSNNQLINSRRQSIQRPALTASSSSSSTSSAISYEELYRDLCRSKRRIVENLLSEDESGRSNWKHLAIHLGYSPAQILEFDLKRGPFCSSRRFLNDWSCQQHRGATTRVLSSALSAISRNDVLALIMANQDQCFCIEKGMCHLYKHQIVDII
ncbi:hypothetical protein CHUAL_005227 [Chamberlinius hualienensis]